MRLQYFQHVAFEDLAEIATWAGARGATISATRCFAGEAPPAPKEFDWLVIMGGPMNIYEEDLYPWLKAEKAAIAAAIAAGKTVVGVCLGAQLIADVLGGPVSRNAHKEIGWFPVELTPQAGQSAVFRKLPASFEAFHWHGDTFAIPPGAVHAAASEGCRNQAFVYQDRVVGLQFHLESSQESIKKLIDNCGDELVAGRYIQSAAQMLPAPEKVQEINGIMARLLDNLAGLGA